MRQIHDQECDVIEHVDHGQGIVEFDRIEQGRRAVEQTDISKMQIAVADFDVPAGFAFAEQVTVFIQHAHGGLAQLGHGGCGILMRECRKLRKIVFGHPAHTFVKAEAARDAFGRCVEHRNPVGQLLHERARKPALACHAVEQIGIREAVHLDRPLDRLARPAERDGAIIRPGDGENAAIERRRGASIARDLRLAGGVAAIERAEIHVGIANRALDLVGTLFSEKNDRAMCVDARGRAWAEAARLAHEVERRTLIGIVERRHARAS